MTEPTSQNVREASAWSWGHESDELHTRLLRLSLGCAEARAYLAHVDVDVVGVERLEAARRHRWFGDKSDARVKFLLSALQERFDAFPNAVGALRTLAPELDDASFALVCHFHVQLTDPLYRRFSGELLVERRAAAKEGRATLALAFVERWLERRHRGRWAESTRAQFASKLFSTAAEAGLVAGARAERSVLTPRVPDRALAYLLYLLRETRFGGSFGQNPYVASVAVDLGERLAAGVPGVAGRVEAPVFAAPDLRAFSLR